MNISIGPSTAPRVADEWLSRIRRSIVVAGCGGDVPVDVWDHQGTYVLARHLGAAEPATHALGILVLTAIGAPRPLINDELRRLRLWDGATQALARTSPSKGQFFRREPVPLMIDRLGDEWRSALAPVPRKLYRVNRESRFGAIYCGPKWWMTS